MKKISRLVASIGRVLGDNSKKPAGAWATAMTIAMAVKQIAGGVVAIKDAVKPKERR